MIFINLRLIYKINDLKQQIVWLLIALMICYVWLMTSNWWFARMDGNIFKQFIKQSASYFNSIMCIIVPIQKAVQNALSSKRALYGFLMCVMIL